MEWRSLIALILFVLVLGFFKPEFLSTANFLNILKQTSVNALIAVGMTFVILTAGIDLSVGSVLALCGAVAATLVNMDVNIVFVVAATMGLGLFLGSISGLIVARGGVQPFIATLVMMTMLRGVTMVFSEGRPIRYPWDSDVSKAMAWFGRGDLMGVPVPVVMMILVFAVAWFVLNHTRFGRYVYALGGNEKATALSGINVNKIKVMVYAISGLTAALAAILVTARLGSAQPTAGMAYELDAIAAVVIGGTSLAGGRGRIIGTLIGALIIGVLNNALNMLDVSSYYQMIVKAVVILLAVLVDRQTSKT
jgi:ribose transport system permease protein